MIEKIKKTFFTKQFFIFLGVGCVNTLAGTIFSILYSKIMQANIAFVVGYLSGTIVSYLLNSIFTFKARLNIKKYFSFFINVIPNFIIQTASVFLIYNILHYDKIIAYVLAAIIGLPVTFVLLKLNTFKQRKKK